jgi:hypothetical protein
MARKAAKTAQERVTLIATNRTQDAREGAVARPLVADEGAWLARGWVREAQPESTADEG